MKNEWVPCTSGHQPWSQPLPLHLHLLPSLVSQILASSPFTHTDIMVSIISNDSYKTLVAPTVSEVEALESPIKTISEISPGFPSFAADSGSCHDLIDFGAEDSSPLPVADSDDSNHGFIDSGCDSSPRSTGVEAVKLDEQPTNVKCVESNHQLIDTEFPELDQHGLLWEEGILGFEPLWSVEPKIEDIKKTVQSLRPSSTVEVGFLAQGGFNKVYNVTVDGKAFIMRVSLPVDPHFKVLSEVATMDWVREVTQLPIPTVMNFQSSRENCIGFEWIFMTKMPGRPFNDVWLSLSFDAKSFLVRQLASSSAALFQRQFRGIGNIYGGPSSTLDSASSSKLPHIRNPIKATAIARMDDLGLDGSYDLPSNDEFQDSWLTLDRIVSMQFFWHLRLRQRVSRGPFHSSKDWIAARLAIIGNEYQSILDRLQSENLTEDEEDVKDDAEQTLRIVELLIDLLPRFFPPDHDHEEPEPSVVFHDDINNHNLLVNDDGELTGVLDWEFVSAVPLWKACDYPFFLQGPSVPSKPDPDRYPCKRDGTLSKLYHDHLWGHEATCLRSTFIDEMKKLDGRWVEIFDKSQHLRDLDTAVQNCDNSLWWNFINAWIQDIISEKDNIQSLQDRHHQNQFRPL